MTGRDRRDQEGAAMVLALVFLVFCMFMGSTVLTAAALQSAATRESGGELLCCRSAALVCADRLGSGLSLTVRDVTVTGDGDTGRTVIYTDSGADTLLALRLRDSAIAAYEQEFGVPDRRDAPGYTPVGTEPAELLLTAEDITVRGLWEMEDGYSLVLRLSLGTASLCLRMEAVVGSGEPVTVTHEGVTTVTRTTHIRWSEPVIGKGDGDAEA